MEVIKKFLENKSSAEKRKYIVYGIAGVVCILLIVIVVALNSKNDTKRVDDFSNPDAKEVEKYNSRVEANKMRKIDSSSLNVVMNDIFGEQKQQSYTTDNTNQYVVPDYSNDNANSKSENYNLHSTYGDYSMWKAEEPQNSSIGYTEFKTFPKENEKSNSNNNTRYIEPDSEGSEFSSISENQENKISSRAKKIRAKLLSTGFAMNGRSLSFIMVEPAIIGGEQVPKGQVVTGVAKIMDDRLKVKLINLKVNGKDIDIKGCVIGFDGEEGIPIVGGDEDGGSEEYIKEQASIQASRIPVVGGIISGLSRSKRNRENKVKLNQNTDCIIAIY